MKEPLQKKPGTLDPQDEGVNYAVVLRLIRKFWATALGTAMAVVLAFTFQTLGQTKIYQATATLQLDPNPPRPLGQKVEAVVEMGNGSYWNNREYYETQYKVIQSMRVASAVVRELGLDHDPRFLRNLPPDAKVQAKPATEEEAAEALRDRLKVEAVKDSRLAVVSVEDADPARAQRVLAAVIDTYVQQNMDDALNSTNEAASWLHGQLDKLKGDLESSEMALHEYKRNKNILSVAFDDQSNMLRDQMKHINDALVGVKTRSQEVAARLSELKKVRDDDPSDLPASELLQSALLQHLREQYSEALRDRQALLGSGKGKEHPEVKAAENKVTAARIAVLEEVKNVRGSVEKDLEGLAKQEGGLTTLFDKAKAQALDLNLLEIEYKQLERAKDNNEKLFSLVQDRTKESDLTRVLRVNNIRIIDRPLVPRIPVRPRIPINIALGILLGTALGLCAALARGTLDRSIKTPDDIEQELKIPALGLIPVMEAESSRKGYGSRTRKRERAALKDSPPELVVHSAPMSGIAEASRAIRTNLMFMAPDNPFRVLLVTSASPSEGKTTVACCVSIAMAQAGQRVLLIDCDLRRPRVHKIFRKQGDTGVTTALLGEGDAVQETMVPNLSIIASGPIPPNPAEILHSERFREFLQRMSTQYDRVIIDSPPVVAVTDAAILSTLADASVLVVRAFSTRKDVARHALRTLQDVGAKPAGTILNAVDLTRHEYKDSYYYYYRRDYYTNDTREAERASRDAPPSQPPPDKGEAPSATA